MGKVIAVTNQKGGVGKTTTANQLGAGLAERGKRILFVDMDAQCNLSYILGVDSDDKTILHVMNGKKNVGDVIQRGEYADVLAGSTYMSAVDMYLPAREREYSLKKALDQVKGMYDYVIIDSPPTLGTATVNTLTASDLVIVPAQADIYSLQGMGQLFSTVQTVKKLTNPGLVIAGILLTRHNDRYNHSRQMRETIGETARMMGTKVFRSAIRESVAVREAATMRKSIFSYRPKATIAADYSSFIDEFLADENER